MKYMLFSACLFVLLTAQEKAAMACARPEFVYNGYEVSGEQVKCLGKTSVDQVAPDGLSATWVVPLRFEQGEACESNVIFELKMGKELLLVGVTKEGDVWDLRTFKLLEPQTLGFVQVQQEEGAHGHLMLHVLMSEYLESHTFAWRTTLSDDPDPAVRFAQDASEWHQGEVRIVWKQKYPYGCPPEPERDWGREERDMATGNDTGPASQEVPGVQRDAGQREMMGGQGGEAGLTEEGCATVSLAERAPSWWMGLFGILWLFRRRRMRQERRWPA